MLPSRVPYFSDAFALYAMVLAGASQVTVAPAAGSIIPGGGAAAAGGHFIAADAAYAISSRGVTVTAMAAAQLAIILEHEQLHKHSLRTLRLVSCGGSSLSPELIQSLWAAAPAVTYFTDYGMTEAGGRVCTTLVLPSEEAIMRRMPASDRAKLLSRAGRAVPGVEILVVTRPKNTDSDASSLSSPSSPSAQDAPPLASPPPPPPSYVPVRRDGKEIGEVLIRGDCVFKGYWDAAARWGGAS